MSTPPAASYDGTIERTDDGGFIRFERLLPYEIREVWDAVTDPERLAEWWLPFDADITIDLREGGEMVFAGRGDDPFSMTFTVLRVEAPMLLEHTHADEGSVLRWELEPVDSGTILRLSHYVPDLGVAIDRCYLVGLHTSLSRLVPCLEGHPIPWDQADFEVSQAHYATLGFAPAVES